MTKVGNFVVVENYGTYAVRQVARITELTYFYAAGRGRLTDVLFSGPKDQANLLAQQLSSSRAQYYEDQRAAGQRRDERNQKFIAAANAAVVKKEGEAAT